MFVFLQNDTLLCHYLDEQGKCMILFAYKYKVKHWNFGQYLMIYLQLYVMKAF